MFTPFSNPPDCWDTSNVVEELLFTNGNRSVELSESGDNYSTLYGEVEIESGRYEWVIRVDKCGDRQAVLGVATGSALEMVHGKFCQETTGFGFGMNGTLRSGGSIVSGTRDCSLHEGDILSIRLNLSAKKLTFAKNGILLDFEIHKLPIGKYKLALSLIEDDEKYTIVNGTDYLSRFTYFQYRVSQLALNDAFAYTGTRNQLSFSIHNTYVTHTPPRKQVYLKKLQKKQLVIDEGIDSAYGDKLISNGTFEWILQIQGTPQYITVGVWGQPYSNESDLKSGPWLTEFDKSKYGYGLRGNGKKYHNTKIKLDSPRTMSPTNSNSRNIRRNMDGIGNRSRNKYFNRTNEDEKTVDDNNNNNNNNNSNYDSNLAMRQYRSKYHSRQSTRAFSSGEEAYCSGFSTNDIVCVRLDLNKRTLSFSRNGFDLGVAYRNIFYPKSSFGYRLAVKMRKQGCKIWLLAAHEYTEDTIVKLSSIDDFNKTLKQTNNKKISNTKNEKKLISNIDFDNNTTIPPKYLFDYLDKLHIGLLQCSNSIKDTCNKLAKVKRLKRAQLDNKNQDSKLSNESETIEFLLSLPQLFKCQSSGKKLLDSQREFQRSLNQWINFIQPTIIGHFKDWVSWSSDDIADWIIGLENGRFKSYETVLRRELKTAKVSGKHLRMLTQNITYLQRFGIVEFDEELALQTHIQNLVDGKIKDQLFKGYESNSGHSSRRSSGSYRSIKRNNSSNEKSDNSDNDKINYNRYNRNDKNERQYSSIRSNNRYNSDRISNRINDRINNRINNRIKSTINTNNTNNNKSNPLKLSNNGSNLSTMSMMSSTNNIRLKVRDLNDNNNNNKNKSNYM